MICWFEFDPDHGAYIQQWNRHDKEGLEFSEHLTSHGRRFVVLPEDSYVEKGFRSIDPDDLKAIEEAGVDQSDPRPVECIVKEQHGTKRTFPASFGAFTLERVVGGKEAGDRLDRLTRQLMERYKLGYAAAFAKVSNSYPRLAEAYRRGW